MTTPTTADIQATIKDYIIAEITFGELSDDEIDHDTHLLAGGVLNSMTIMQMITHLETRYAFQAEPTDVVIENFASIASMARWVESKIASASVARS